MKTEYAAAEPYVTKDGSVIRELLHPSLHAVRNMSLAEAIVEGGTTTMLHRHRLSEEIYHVTEGAGLMRLGAAEFAIKAGDTIVIAPNTTHNVTNTGVGLLKILCACHPAYAHEDTELV